MEEDRLRNELKKDTEYKEGCSVGQCDWSGLAEDVLKLIINHLHVVDRIAIASVCRSWRSVMLPVNPHNMLRYGQPCLLYMRESACHLLDPVHRHKHTFEIPGLEGAKILLSKDGWLLMSWRHHTEDEDTLSMCLLNPFSKARIELPPLKTDAFGQFSISDRPTSPSCVVVGFLMPLYFDVEIGLCRRGDAQWTIVERPCNITLYGFLTNPVWCSGSFYCLDARGNLGVFDPSEQTWTVLGKQEDLGKIVNKHPEQYLVEVDGDLFRVCDMGGSVLIFRLDTPTNKWVSVKDLGDTVLFVGRQDCVSTIALDESMKGKIYFNRVRGEDVVNRALGSGDPTASAPASGKLKEFLFSSWVDLEWSQPALDWSSM